MQAIEIEIDGPRNEALFFRPTRTNVRGRFDWSRVGNAEAMRTAQAYGGVPIPGQRLRLEGNKCSLVEPLAEDQHEALRERIEAKGFAIPKGEDLGEVDPVTVGWFMQQAVESGVAKLVSGKFPTFDETRVRKDFLVKREPSERDLLLQAMDRQTAVLEKLADAIAATAAARNSK